VENIAVGCSQVNFVQQGSGNILYNFWYVFWFSTSKKFIKLLIFNKKCVKSDVFHYLFLRLKHDLFLPSLKNPYIFKKKRAQRISSTKTFDEVESIKTNQTIKFKIGGAISISDSILLKNVL